MGRKKAKASNLNKHGHEVKAKVKITEPEEFLLYVCLICHQALSKEDDLREHKLEQHGISTKSRTALILGKDDINPLLVLKRCSTSHNSCVRNRNVGQNESRIMTKSVTTVNRSQSPKWRLKALLLRSKDLKPSVVLQRCDSTSNETISQVKNDNGRPAFQFQEYLLAPSVKLSKSKKACSEKGSTLFSSDIKVYDEPFPDPEPRLPETTSRLDAEESDADAGVTSPPYEEEVDSRCSGNIFSEENNTARANHLKEKEVKVIDLSDGENSRGNDDDIRLDEPNEPGPSQALNPVQPVHNLIVTMHETENGVVVRISKTQPETSMKPVGNSLDSSSKLQDQAGENSTGTHEPGPVPATVNTHTVTTPDREQRKRSTRKRVCRVKLVEESENSDETDSNAGSDYEGFHNPDAATSDSDVDVVETTQLQNRLPRNSTDVIKSKAPRNPPRRTPLPKTPDRGAAQIEHKLIKHTQKNKNERINDKASRRSARILRNMRQSEDIDDNGNRSQSAQQSQNLTKPVLAAKCEQINNEPSDNDIEFASPSSDCPQSDTSSEDNFESSSDETSSNKTLRVKRRSSKHVAKSWYWCWCKLCKSKFYIIENLRTHQMAHPTHHSSVSFSCKACDQDYKKMLLRNYRSYHDGLHEGMYKDCTQCEKPSSINSRYTYTHDPGCKKLFHLYEYPGNIVESEEYKKSLQLLRHNRLHKGPMSKCQQCLVSFFRILPNPIFAVVSNPNQILKPGEIFQCSVCFCSYTHLQHVEKHQKLRHTEAELSAARAAETYKTENTTDEFSAEAREEDDITVLHPSGKKNSSISECLGGSQSANDDIADTTRAIESDDEIDLFEPVYTIRKKRDVFNGGEKSCPHCGKKAINIKNLNMHIISQHIRRYVCKICKKSFRYPAGLQEHEKVHTGIKEYLCPTCGKSFATGSLLKTHEKYTHENYKKLPCDVCKLKFSSVSCLNRHKKYHVVMDRSFLCNLCGKGFRFKNHLMVHIRKAHEPKSYKCSKCDAILKHLCGLRLHERSVHADLTKPQICPVCGKKYKNLHTLTNHSYSHSGKHGKHECKICHKRFTKGKYLREHAVSHETDQEPPESSENVR